LKKSEVVSCWKARLCK